MKFFIYWLIAMLSVFFASIEKLLKGEDTLFWVYVVCAIFFWLAAYGTREQEKPVPPADDGY